MSKEKLKGRNFPWISFVVLTIMMMVAVTPIYGDYNPAATIQDPNSQIYMDQLVYEFDSPPTEVGDTFYVDVIGYNISEVFAYQVVIDYNASQLSCLDAWPDGGGWTDPDWIFYDLQTWGVGWTSYADAPSAGRNAELIGDSLQKEADEVNLTDPAGEALLARFEFEILVVPEPYEELSGVISITSSWAVGTYVQSAEEATALQKRSPDMTNSEYRNRSSTTENEPPVADDDSYSTNEDTMLSVPVPGVLGNDTDLNLDLLTAENFSDVSHGTLTFNSDGSFTYTPDLNYTGSDSFTYKAWDGQEYSNLATVTITVNPPQAERPPQMYMDQLWYNFTSPPLKAGTKFTVDVYSYNISALYAYQVVILYNASLLNCTNAWPNMGWDDPEWVFNKYGAGAWELTMWTHYESPVSTLPSGFNAELIGDVHSEYSNVSLVGIETLMARFEFEILLDPPSHGEYTCLLDLTNAWMKGTGYATRDEPEILLSPDLINSNFNIKWVLEGLPTDLDGDGIVNIADLSVAALAFGSFPGHPRWNPIADLNKDGWVDISDIVEIAVDFGKTV